MSQSQRPSFLLRWLVVTVGVLILAELLPGVYIQSFTEALLAALLLSLLNAFVRPVLQLIALPITIFTLGIFYFLVNAAMVMWASSWVSGFQVESWWTAVLFSFLLSIFNSLVLPSRKRPD